MIALVFGFSGMLAFRTHAIELLPALAIKVSAAMKADVNHTLVFGLGRGFLLRRSIVNAHTCKGVPANIKDGVDSICKYIALRSGI